MPAEDSIGDPIDAGTWQQDPNDLEERPASSEALVRLLVSAWLRLPLGECGTKVLS
jgi:hypothetical protein